MREFNTEQIGFTIKDNKLELVMPRFMKNVQYSDEEILKEEIKYFKLFRKYRKYSKLDPKEENIREIGSSKNKEYIYTRFEAYYLLLLDYMELGPFIFTTKRSNFKKQGRINWNKTINKGNLIISEENLYIIILII